MGRFRSRPVAKRRAAEPANVTDATPKLASFKLPMRERIAQILGITVGQVNVKAKTAEKMGPVGEGRAMEARAVVLLVRNS